MAAASLTLKGPVLFLGLQVSRGKVRPTVTNQKRGTKFSWNGRIFRDSAQTFPL